MDRPTTEETGEPSCAVPVDIGIGGQPMETLTDQPSDLPPDEEDFSAPPDPLPEPASITPAPVVRESPIQASARADEPTSPRQPDSREKKEMLLAQMKRSNLSLAAALDKALAWNWGENSLLLTFASNYEASLVKNEADTLRRIGTEAGLAPFAVDTVTEKKEDTETGGGPGPRVELVRQVFRGQVMKG